MKLRNIIVGLVLSSVTLGLGCDPKTKTDEKAKAAEVAEKEKAADEKTKDGAVKTEPVKTAASAGPVAPFNATGPIAKVDGVEVTAAMFNEEISMAMGMIGQIPAQAMPEFKSKMIENVVNKYILEAAAEKAPAASADDVAKEFQKFADQAKNMPGGLEAFYKKSGASEAKIKEEIAKSLRLRVELAKTHDIDVKDADVKKFYDDNKARFSQEAQVRASHILFKSDDKDAKKKANNIAKLAKKKDADFAALAKEHSQGPSGPNGGDLNFFTKEKMVPEFSKAAFKMKVGEVSKPVKTQFGWHVIKVTEKKAGGATPLAEVKDRIKMSLDAQKMKQGMDDFLKKRRVEAKIEMMPENVKDNPAFKPAAPQMPPGLPPGFGGGAPGQPAKGQGIPPKLKLNTGGKGGANAPKLKLNSK